MIDATVSARQLRVQHAAGTVICSEPIGWQPLMNGRILVAGRKRVQLCGHFLFSEWRECTCPTLRINRKVIIYAHYSRLGLDSSARLYGKHFSSKMLLMRSYSLQCTHHRYVLFYRPK